MKPLSIVQLTSEHKNENLFYDSQWHFNFSEKYFEAERFIYCRVHDDHHRNHNPTVIMMLVYLKAKKKHQETIMRELENAFSTMRGGTDTSMFAITKKMIDDKDDRDATGKKRLEDIMHDDALPLKGGLLMLVGLTVFLLYPFLLVTNST